MATWSLRSSSFMENFRSFLIERVHGFRYLDGFVCWNRGGLRNFSSIALPLRTSWNSLWRIKIWVCSKSFVLVKSQILIAKTSETLMTFPYHGFRIHPQIEARNQTKIPHALKFGPNYNISYQTVSWNPFSLARAHISKLLWDMTRRNRTTRTPMEVWFHPFWNVCQSNHQSGSSSFHV